MSGVAGKEVDWLRELREAAAVRFAERGLPTKRDEDFKYLDLGPIRKREFGPAPVAAAGLPSELPVPETDFELSGPRLTFVNGRYCDALSERSRLPDGVTATDLAGLLERDPGAAEHALARIADPEIHRLVDWNTASFSDGAFVRLAAGTVLQQPILLLFVTTDEEVEFVNHPRVLILAEAEARATVVERHLSVGSAANLTNAVTEVVAGEGASVEHYGLQQHGAKGFHLGSVHVAQARDSRFVSHNFTGGGRLVRNDIHTKLTGEGAEAELFGLYFASGRQLVDNHTQIEHAVPRTRSVEHYKGVLDGHGRAVFNGKVVVHPGADGTDARQSNDNLILSPGAEADTKPQLEIYADDVKCSHGATIGQLDEAALFYLASRGLAEHSARGLLTFAFAGDVLARMRIEPIRKRLENLVAGRFAAGGPTGDPVGGVG